MTPDPVRLAMWSGPRNISTAMMRSWENRPDTAVVDEPLYAHFLLATGIDHPGRAETLAAGETDWRVVVDELLGPVPGDAAIYYQKHMAHHLVGDVEHGWMSALTNVLLIRDPREVVASYIRSRDEVTADDIGLPQQVRLYDEWVALGQTPRVIDSADFLQDPRGLPARTVRPGRHRVHRRDAELAGRTPRHRRGLGSVLVRRGLGLDRLRGVPAS